MPAVETTGVIGSPVVRTYQAAAAAQKRGTFMKQGADDQHAAAATANAVCLGVQEEDTVNANDPTSVVMSGEAVIICGAAVSAGQFLISDASGHAIPSTTAGDNVVAQAISSATSAGDFFVGQIVKFIR